MSTKTPNQPQINWIKCTGEAHSNPFIDHCERCMPYWLVIPTCPECHTRLSALRAPFSFRCPNCKTKFVETRGNPAGLVVDPSTDQPESPLHAFHFDNPDWQRAFDMFAQIAQLIGIFWDESRPEHERNQAKAQAIQIQDDFLILRMKIETESVVYPIPAIYGNHQIGVNIHIGKFGEICKVRIDSLFTRPEATFVTINWSALGDQNRETAAYMAQAMLLAVECAKMLEASDVQA